MFLEPVVTTIDKFVNVFLWRENASGYFVGCTGQKKVLYLHWENSLRTETWPLVFV